MSSSPSSPPNRSTKVPGSAASRERTAAKADAASRPKKATTVGDERRAKLAAIKARKKAAQEAKRSKKRSGSDSAGGTGSRTDDLSRRDIQRIEAIRTQWMAPADQPLLLIAQPTRSGGTLLSQLFDGHPQLHAHPYELEIGHPTSNVWPVLDLAAGHEEWFKQLSEGHARSLFSAGYAKGVDKDKAAHPVEERLPFMLPPSLQRRLFSRLVTEKEVRTPRDILDAYMTSYFNAWLDNQNLYGTEKRWVVGFRSGLGTPENVEAFFADYPDGRHLGCVRDAKGWIGSRRRLWGHRAEGRTIDDYIELWTRLTKTRLEIAQRYDERAFLCTFEHLVTETPSVMQSVAAWLAIEWDPVLTVPTFNRFPMRSNSSFGTKDPGVAETALKNHREELTAAEIRQIDASTRGLYEEVEELSSRHNRH